jgi:S-adenosylmethionine:tRNA ribosyltransferase-isomerase
MDSEEMYVDEALVDMVNKAKDDNKHVCAVGTSVMRGLASAVCMNGHLMTYEGWTNKFIFAPYEFTVADAMVTNFHLPYFTVADCMVSNFHMPYSTMLMMVAAFGGYDIVMKAYNEAVKEKYGFGAYGDAMLILK